MSADVQAWLDAGNTITQIPDAPPKPILTGSMRMHLTAELQKGERTLEQLIDVFSTKQDVHKAVRSLRQAGVPVYKHGNTYSLEPKVICDLSERDIVRLLGRFYFKYNLMTLNNYFFSKHECDLLSVTPSLRPIEIEIKISRADFMRDKLKDKWQKPVKTWKHYYIMPDHIYKPDMIEHLPNERSGILTIIEKNGKHYINTKKGADIMKDCKISASQMVNMARIINQRYWSDKL